MKWYKYWKVYMGIGIFFTLSVLSGAIANIIFAILFLYLGITQRKKAYANTEYIEEIEHRKQQKALAKIPHEERYKDCKNIHTKIVGVTFKNSDGSSRQDYLCYLNHGEELFLKEYSYKGNPAFYVCNKHGKCLGNLPAEIAEKIKKKYDTNEKFVFVEEIRKFDKNEVNDDYDNDKKEPDYIYYCEIVIYFK